MLGQAAVTTAAAMPEVAVEVTLGRDGTGPAGRQPMAELDAWLVHLDITCAIHVYIYSNVTCFRCQECEIGRMT